MRRVGAGAIHAEEARAGDTVVVLAALAHGALSAPDPRIDEALVADLHAARAGAESLHDAKGFVTECKRRYAATLLHVEALAAAQVEVALPDVQVGVADARAGDAHQHFAALRLRRLGEHLLQRPAVLDDLIADHCFRRLASNIRARAQRLVDVPEDVVERLDADRHADHVGRYPGL